MKLFNLFVWDGLFYVLSTLQHVSLHRMQGPLVLVLCFFCVYSKVAVDPCLKQCHQEKSPIDLTAQLIACMLFNTKN